MNDEVMDVGCVTVIALLAVNLSLFMSLCQPFGLSSIGHYFRSQKG